MKRDLDQRLRKFVQRILNLARHLTTVGGAQRIADQISRCGPSIRFNYAESQAASSRAHFISIVEIAEREARETKVVLETIMDVPFVKPSRLTDDGSGKRVRKVHEQKTAGGKTIDEVIYLSGIEIRRTKTQATVTKEWHTVRVMDGDDCFCVWQYWQKGTIKNGAKKYQLRYQLNDMLNSSVYERDEVAKIIRYRIQDTRYKIQDTRYRIKDSGFKTHLHFVSVGILASLLIP